MNRKQKLSAQIAARRAHIIAMHGIDGMSDYVRVLMNCQRYAIARFNAI